MKLFPAFLSVFFFISCANGKEKNFTGSTPADAVIRTFLGIPLSDSVDFIRWKLTFHDKTYSLHCNYGIGKPNTNGFINGGKKIEVNDVWRKTDHYYHLQNGNKSVMMAELNDDLLHLLHTDNSMLAGNGGWSYTLCNTSPAVSDDVNFFSPQIILKDSMGFVGRTPCGIPGIVEPGKECYKLKWYVVLYGNPGKNEPTTYRVLGTGWRVEGGKKGTWKIITGKNGRIIYQLNDDNGKGFLYLLKPSENILLFTDAEGKLLVGDEDFSYTLSRSM